MDGEFAVLVGLIDGFCDARLDDEYKELCRAMAAMAFAAGAIAGASRLEGWACGIVNTIGRVNFLMDPSETPHVRAEEIHAHFGVSAATMHKRTSELRKMFDLITFDPRWTLERRLIDNPLVWMIETRDGMLLDARCLPREQQEQAFNAGLIPFVPAERAAGAPEQGVIGRNGM